MRVLSTTVFLLLFLSLAAAQSATPAETAKKPGNVSFSADMIDKNVDPCTDFYAYACSKWQAQNPVPSDQPGWGRFNELQERGQFIVRDILSKYSADDSKRSAVEQKIGDYYQSCMDEGTIENAGTRPLQEEFKTLPLGVVWEQFCERQNVPVGQVWVAEVKRYERDVLSLRA